LAVSAYLFDRQSDVAIKGLNLVKQGMTRDEVLAVLGAPRKQQATIMGSWFYGMPDDIAKRIGPGNPFEMLEYEESIPRKSVGARVWLCPDPDDWQEMRVLDVSTSCVCRSLWFRTVHAITDRFPSLGLDD
jgi:hypothetical protein